MVGVVCKKLCARNSFTVNIVNHCAYIKTEENEKLKDKDSPEIIGCDLYTLEPPGMISITIKIN